MEPLESVIAYKFRNSLLLAEALSHPSLAYETQKPQLDNQRLEFLGDAVVQMVLTRELFDRFPEGEEGLLTKMRARMVSRDALAELANRIPLGPYLMMGRGEEASGGRIRNSSLCDAFEALAGAIYLDGGLEAAHQFILRFASEQLDELTAEPTEFNPKGQLQEILQSVSNEPPCYAIVRQEGPDHAKMFVAQVTWKNRPLAVGEGPSKKIAEMDAARAALECQEIRSLAAAAAPQEQPPSPPPTGTPPVGRMRLVASTSSTTTGGLHLTRRQRPDAEPKKVADPTPKKDSDRDPKEALRASAGPPSPKTTSQWR